MANPTSNFNWQMPTASDLVTDLPADFEVFGQAVDTSLADLKGGTTGQILAKASNTDMDFTWTAGGDITGVSVTSPITGGGSSGDVTIGIASSAVVPSQTGNSGKYLTTDGTTSSWGTISAGGMTLLSTTTMNSPTVTVSSISQAYNRIFVEFIGVQQATTGNTIDILLDGGTVASYTGVLDGAIEENNNDYIKLTLRQAAALNTQMNWSLTVDNYTSTTTYKPFMIYGMGVRLTNTKDTKIIYGGVMKSNSAFDSVTIQSDNGTSNLTGTIKVWGIK
jgi:hypothetical protein